MNPILTDEAATALETAAAPLIAWYAAYGNPCMVLTLGSDGFWVTGEQQIMFLAPPKPGDDQQAAQG